MRPFHDPSYNFNPDTKVLEEKSMNWALVGKMDLWFMNTQVVPETFSGSPGFS